MRHFTLSIIFSILFTPIILFSQTDIVGGDDANISDYPWNAAVGYQANTGSFFSAYCGGSVINEHWVLTAAHCVQGESPSGLSVKIGLHDQYGTTGSETRNVDQVITHPSYSGWSLNNDNAILHLT